MRHAWSTKLQVRFVGTVLLVSTVVMSVLGFALASVVTDRITAAKIETASVEIERARSTVDYQLANSGSSASLQARLNSARAGLTQRVQESGDSASFYEPVLVVEAPNGSVTS